MPMINESRSKATTTAEFLATQIGDLQEGDRLGTKKELAPQLGVAPGTLNEAIRLLQERGLISLRSGPKGGIFVARFDQSSRLGQVLGQVGQDSATVAGALETKRALEDVTVIDAARHCGDDDAAHLTALAARLGEVATDQKRLFIALADLHTAIARVSPNGMLRSIYLGLLMFLRDHDRRSLAPRSRGALRSLVNTHSQLVEAIVSNDESRCRELLGEHTEDGCELRWS